MNLVELDQALRKLCLSGMANFLETRLLQAQTEQMAPIDLLAALVSDELQRREDRLLARRHKQARFRDPDRSLDGFDFAFNKKINRALVFELATARFVAKREDVLLIGQPGTGKSHLAQAIGRAAIQQGLSRPLPRNAHLPRRTRRGNARRDPQGIPRRARPRAPAHHRRPRHAQAAPYRRRGPARADHAPLRAGLDDAHRGQDGREVHAHDDRGAAPGRGRANAEVLGCTTGGKGREELTAAVTRTVRPGSPGPMEKCEAAQRRPCGTAPRRATRRRSRGPSVRDTGGLPQQARHPPRDPGVVRG